MAKIVAIDGPAGSGKSTVSKLLADKLGIGYVDTGATYRLVALRAMQSGVALDDAASLAELARETMRRSRLAAGRVLEFDGAPVGDEIRTPEVSETTSIVSAHPDVRQVLVEFQRALVPSYGAVVEGRDIGTVVWPNAELKVYLDASPDVRAQRRSDQQGDPSAVAVEVHERDERDATRPVGAMRPADDAVVVDTSRLSAEQVVDRIIGLDQPKPVGPWYWFVRGFLALLCRLVFRLEITGTENIPPGGAIIAPNHRSLIDIPIAAAITPRKLHFMAKEELFRNKLAAKFFTSLGGFSVKRGKPDRSALTTSLDILNRGELLGIFPEGTRTPEGRFGELEDGFVYIALKTGAPIVPVAISDSAAVFPPGRKLPKLVKIRVRIGKPFRLEGGTGLLPKSRIREATTEARMHLDELMNAVEPR